MVKVQAVSVVSVCHYLLVLCLLKETLGKSSVILTRPCSRTQNPIFQFVLKFYTLKNGVLCRWWRRYNSVKNILSCCKTNWKLRKKTRQQIFLWVKVLSVMRQKNLCRLGMRNYRPANNAIVRYIICPRLSVWKVCFTVCILPWKNKLLKKQEWVFWSVFVCRK